MKQATAIAIALLIAATAQALPRHVVMAVPVATWDNVNPSPRNVVKVFFRRFADPKATVVVGVTEYADEATGAAVYITAFWTEQLTRYNERLDADKLAKIQTQLAKKGVRLALTDDLHGQLSAWGLKPVAREDDDGNPIP